jgi:hypothetical protein
MKGIEFFWRNCRVEEACGMGFALRTRTPSMLYAGYYQNIILQLVLMLLWE